MRITTLADRLGVHYLTIHSLIVKRMVRGYHRVRHINGARRGGWYIALCDVPKVTIEFLEDVHLGRVGEQKFLARTSNV